MKKLFVFVAVCLFAMASSSAVAQHRDRHARVFDGRNWVAPVLIGGAIAYTMTRPPVIPQTIIIQDTYPMAPPDPTLIIVDGVVYRKAVVNVNGYLREVMIRQ